MAVFQNGLKLPWPYLDSAEPLSRASEFGTPIGYVDPDAYRPKTASESLPHALVDGNPNDG